MKFAKVTLASALELAGEKEIYKQGGVGDALLNADMTIELMSLKMMTFALWQRGEKRQ